MEKQLKLQRPQKILPIIAGYSVPEKDCLLSTLGVPIVFGERKEYVCGGCHLLLKKLGLRCLLRSHFEVLPMMYYMPPVVLLRSVDGCELSILNPTFSLFPNYHPMGESIFMVCSLDCHKVGEISISARVKIPNVYVSSMEVKDQIEYSQIYGKLDSLIANKRTGLTDWQVIFPSTSQTLLMSLFLPQ